MSTQNKRKKKAFGDYPSSRKAARQTDKRTAINKSRISKIRTYIKKVLQSKKLEEASSNFLRAQKIIMKGVTKKVLKLNKASRIVKLLAAKVKSISLCKKQS